MRNRPGRETKIYDALRGPSASEAQVTIVKNHKGELISRCKYEWFEDEPLFLYAGRRHCVEEEKENTSVFGTLSSLFKEKKQSSEKVDLFVRKENFKHPGASMYVVNANLKEDLVGFCGTTGKSFPIIKLKNKKESPQYV